MSNYSVLKQDINNNIYENQTQQITGTVLNAILNEMTASLGAGYQFAGVATLGMNPGDPDQRVFYLAGEGIYTNFGGLQVPQGKLGVLKWDFRWTLQTIDGLGGGGANLTGYVSLASTDDLPEEGQPTLGYLCGTNLYLYVGTGGDTKEGKYQNCGSFRGPQGLQGDPGVGIATVTQTTTSTEDEGINVITVTKEDGTQSTFQVRNGSKGSQGIQGPQGVQGEPGRLQAQYKEVETLPTASADTVDYIYLVASQTPNTYDMYYTEENQGAYSWKSLGTTAVQLSDYATKAEVNQLEAKVDENFDEINEVIKREDDDALYIQDGNGYAIAKFDAKGLTTTDLHINGDGITDEQDELIVIDSNDFIAAKLTKRGLSIGNIQRFSKYQLVTVGDSLSANNVWNTKCAELLGCSFDAEANVKPGQMISQGGTRTWYGGLDSAFFRVKNLVDQNIISGDGENAIIILENINDYNAGPPNGTIQDKSVVPSTPIETGKTEEEFTSSYLQSIVAQGHIDACCTLIRQGNGKVLKVTNLPSTEGDITLNVGSSGTGTLAYSIHLSAPFTMENVINKILEYSYSGVTDVAGDNADEVVFAADGNGYTTYLQFTDTGNTGMTVTITDTSTAKVRYTKFFKGETMADWADLSKWENGTTYMTAYRAFKSCIEYLIGHYPKAHIFLTGFPLYSVNPAEYIENNGNYRQYEFSQTNYQIWQREFIELHKELCELYHIPYINVADNCGINLANMSTYYYANDVHPKDIGYYRMAKVVAKEIENNIK